MSYVSRIWQELPIKGLNHWTADPETERTFQRRGHRCCSPFQLHWLQWAPVWYGQSPLWEPQVADFSLNMCFSTGHGAMATGLPAPTCPRMKLPGIKPRQRTRESARPSSSRTTGEKQSSRAHDSRGLTFNFSTKEPQAYHSKEVRAMGLY